MESLCIKESIMKISKSVQDLREEQQEAKPANSILNVGGINPKKSRRRFNKRKTVGFAESPSVCAFEVSDSELDSNTMDQRVSKVEEIDEEEDEEEHKQKFKNRARRMSMGAGSTGLRKSITDEQKARRGSVIDPRGLLNNMVDPLGDDDVQRMSIPLEQNDIKAIHDDLINAKKREIRRGNVSFVKNNLVTLPSIISGIDNPDEFFSTEEGYIIEEQNEFDNVRNSYGKPTTFDKRKSLMAPNINVTNSSVSGKSGGLSVSNNGEHRIRPSFFHDTRKSFHHSTNGDRRTIYKSNGLNEEGFLANTDKVIPRTSVFYKKQTEEMDDDALFRRNTFAAQKKQRTVERFGILKKISSKAEDGSIIEEKRTFKSLVQAIIRARRWNVPLYYGATDDPGTKITFNSPMDFDLSKFKADSWSCCTSRAKFLMTLEPWERSEADVDIIYRTVKRMKAFTKYSKQIKRELCRVVMLDQFGAGRIILQQGHYGVSMYFILSGVVSVQITSTDPKTGEKFTQIVSEIKAGSSFGELALVKDIRRTAAVVCKCDSEFLRLDRNDFDNVLRRSMEIEWNERMNQLKNIPYFIDWPLHELKTINIRSKIQSYKINTAIIGDMKAGQLPENVYFLTKGRLNIVRKISMHMTSKKIGHHNPKIVYDYTLASDSNIAGSHTIERDLVGGMLKKSILERKKALNMSSPASKSGYNSPTNRKSKVGNLELSKYLKKLEMASKSQVNLSANCKRQISKLGTGITTQKQAIRSRANSLVGITTPTRSEMMKTVKSRINIGDTVNHKVEFDTKLLEK
jgi:hypothetical protein